MMNLKTHENKKLTIPDNLKEFTIRTGSITIPEHKVVGKFTWLTHLGVESIKELKIFNKTRIPFYKSCQTDS
jgi:hypothetical protein